MFSDAGLLLFKEFLYKIGATELVKRIFKTNDPAWFRIHKDDANLMKVIYQIISAYFQDDYADELTNEPVMKAILDKDALASRPTLSRFFQPHGQRHTGTVEPDHPRTPQGRIFHKQTGVHTF